VPSAATTVRNTSPVGVVTVIASPGVPLPSMLGVVSLVRESPKTPLSELGARVASGAVGANVSPVTATVAVREFVVHLQLGLELA
jgi:hypothetical protein